MFAPTLSSRVNGETDILRVSRFENPRQSLMRNRTNSTGSAFVSVHSNSPRLTSKMDAMSTAVLPENVNNLINSIHRKLDRSVSEPASGDRLKILNNNNILSQQSQLSNAAVNSSRYKTELCRPFEESGHCKYGDKCQFAHGVHELRTLPRHPKYKTELCRTFHTIGFCPYGPRCHFIHNEDERRLNHLVNANQQANTARTQVQQMRQQQQQIRQQLKPHFFPPIQTPVSLGFGSLSSPVSGSDSSLSSGSPTSLSPSFIGDDMLSTCATSGNNSPRSASPNSVAYDFNPDIANTNVLALLKVQTQTGDEAFECLLRTLELDPLRLGRPQPAITNVQDCEEVDRYFRFAGPEFDVLSNRSTSGSSGYPSSPESTYESPTGDNPGVLDNCTAFPLAKMAGRLPCFDQLNKNEC